MQTNKEIIVKTQAELENIDKDFGGYIYLEGGMEYNPLILRKKYEFATIVARGNCQLVMQGNSTVQDMQDNSTVQYMWGDSIVQHMWDSSTVQHMWGNSTVQHMWGNSTVQEMEDNSTVQHMWGNSTVQEMEGSSTVQEMRGNSTVQLDRKCDEEMESECG